MPIITTDSKYYNEIAEAIRAKNGTTNRYTPAQMAEAIIALNGGLPFGYTLLDYIESNEAEIYTGQYIDTGVIPSNNDFSVVMKASASVITEENWFLTVNRDMPAGTATYLQFGVRGNSTFATHLTYVAIDGSTSATTDVVNITFSVKGSTATQSGDATNTMTNAYLQSGSYRNSSITIVNGNWRCYSCQIYLSNVLVRDFVPCINPSGEAGLYDRVNAMFYGNAGSGIFITSNTEQGRIPVGYTELEYIQSSGAQYINTGFKPNQDTKVSLDFQLMENPSGSHVWVFGARNAIGAERFDVLRNYNGYWMYGYNTECPQFSATDGTARVSITADKNTCEISGQRITNTYTSFQVSCPILLFAMNTAGEASNFAKARIYSCQIYDNGTLVRNFVPCMNPNGELGLYDIVNANFYKNAGSDSFVNA